MATKDTVASLKIRVAELEAQLATEQSANRELGIKLRQQIARGNRLAENAPPPRSYAAHGEREPSQMRLAMDAAREEAMRTGQSVQVVRP